MSPRTDPTLKEAAESLGVTPATLRQQIRSGTFHAYKRGQVWFVRPAEVERYRRTHLRSRGGNPSLS